VKLNLKSQTPKKTSKKFIGLDFASINSIWL